MNATVKRTPAVNIISLPGSLPVAHVADDVDPAAVAAPFIKRLECLNLNDLTHEALWRDSFALTGTLRTFHTAGVVEAAWKERASRHHPVGFTMNPHSLRIARYGPKRSWVEAGFTFETEGPLPTKCSGFISLVPDGNGGWKIWLLRTILEQLKGYGNPDVLTPRAEVINGTSNGINGHVKPAAGMTNNPCNAVNGYAEPAAEMTNGSSNSVNGHAVNGTSRGTLDGINGHAEPKPFDCVVVGAGQAGLSTAGRMKALGVSCVVLDRHPRVGDNWMLRYDSAKRELALNERWTRECELMCPSPHSQAIW